MNKKSLEERFWSKVIKTDSCWKWIAAKHEFGYGTIATGESLQINSKAHRVSWELHNGIIPDGMCVLHKCDAPECTNPDHLFLGTKNDNVIDMRSKGRNDDSGLELGRTIFNPQTKLTTKQKEAILERYKNIPKRRHGRVAFLKELAVEFNVTPSWINKLTREYRKEGS